MREFRKVVTVLLQEVNEVERVGRTVGNQEVPHIFRQWYAFDLLVVIRCSQANIPAILAWIENIYTKKLGLV